MSKKNRYSVNEQPPSDDKIHFRSQYRIATLAIFSSVVIAWAVYAGYAHSDAKVTCFSGDIGPPSPLRYLQIGLDKQEPREPVFNGRVFVYIQNYQGTVQPLQLEFSAVNNYGSHTFNIPLQLNASGTLTALKMEDVTVIAREGTHFWFPFDSPSFDFQATLNPDLPLRGFIIVNRVPGFLMRCDDIKIKPILPGKYQVGLSLHRDPSVQLVCVVLAVAATVFTFLILTLNKIETLSASVASFFFSLWSVRGIVSSELKTFPSLLDFWLFALCLVLLLGLLWKLSHGKKLGGDD